MMSSGVWAASDSGSFPTRAGCPRVESTRCQNWLWSMRRFPRGRRLSQATAPGRPFPPAGHTLTLGMPVVFCQLDAPAAAVPNGDTHVYVARLADAGPFLPLLADDERARAERFRLAPARDPFVAAPRHP